MFDEAIYYQVCEREEAYYGTNLSNKTCYLSRDTGQPVR